MVFLTISCLGIKRGTKWLDSLPATIGQYAIQTVSNGQELIKIHATESPSECGLSANDFMQFVQDRIDYSRRFLFVVYVDGKPLVGNRCYRKAYIFYLRKK